MTKQGGLHNRTATHLSLLIGIGVYIVVAITACAFLRLGVWVTAFVSLVPIAVVALLALVSAKVGPKQPTIDNFESKGATTRMVTTAAGQPEKLKRQIKANVSQSKRFTLLDEKENTITVKVGISFFTWGAKIYVKLSPSTEGTIVDAECHPYQKTAIVDFGQSRRDLKKILHGIESAT